MAWIPLHEAYPDGTYYVDASDGGGNLIPLEDHPEFSLVDGLVVWERTVDTSSSSPATGAMPRVFFARPGDQVNTNINLRTRVMVEDLHVYTDSAENPVTELGYLNTNDPWGLDSTVDRQEFGVTRTDYEWDHGSYTSTTSLVERDDPTSIEHDAVDPNDVWVNAVSYEFVYWMG